MELIDKNWKPGEAEQLVTTLRAHLRAATTHTYNGDDEAARREEAAANVILEGILKRLAKRFERYAWATFRHAAETREDAVQEMVFEICRALRNVSNQPGAQHFEIRFNQAVQCRLHDAIKKVRREQETDEAGQSALSLDAVIGDDEDGATLLDTLPDPHSDQEVERLLGADLATRLLAELPTPRHTVVFKERLAGKGWEEIAALAKVTEKTARKYYTESETTLRVLVKRREWKE